jgi:hypothetical protein
MARTCYYEIAVYNGDRLHVGGRLFHLQHDRTYYLATNAGIVLKIAYRNTWRIKQVAGPPGRRDKARPESWSDTFYHPGDIESLVLGIGEGFPRADLAERTYPGFLSARDD